MMMEENKENRLSTADMVAAANQREESINGDSEESKEQRSFQEIEESAPLFEDEKVDVFHSRWSDIQTRFVDDPKDSVQDADELVAEVIKSIAETFAEERSYLEDQWNRGSGVSTEDLRISLKRYRSFFNRLLTMER